MVGCSRNRASASANVCYAACRLQSGPEARVYIPPITTRHSHICTPACLPACLKFRTCTMYVGWDQAQVPAGLFHWLCTAQYKLDACMHPHSLTRPLTHSLQARTSTLTRHLCFYLDRLSDCPSAATKNPLRHRTPTGPSGRG